MRGMDTLTDDLAGLLVEEGILGVEQLQQAKKIRARMEEPLPLTSVLVRLGYVNRQQIDELQQRRRRALSVEEIPVSEGLLTQGEFDEAHATAEQQNRSMKDVLLASESVTERQYIRALCTKHELPFIDLEAGEDADIFGQQAATRDTPGGHDLSQARLQRSTRSRCVASVPTVNHVSQAR